MAKGSQKEQILSESSEQATLLINCNISSENRRCIKRTYDIGRPEIGTGAADSEWREHSAERDFDVFY